MLDKLQHGHLHIAVVGRVSTGKSSLLNALIGEQRFAVSPLHGETKHSSMEAWSEVEAKGVYLIDTPGLDEAGGENREELAKEVAPPVRPRHLCDRWRYHRFRVERFAHAAGGRAPGRCRIKQVRSLYNIRT